MMAQMVNGTIVGYDPGGNGAHGVAAISISHSRRTGIHLQTLETAEDVLLWIGEFKDLVGLGVDTLACWGTGLSGWRAADLWLRKAYPVLKSSIVSPNGLYGSMVLNGMALLLSARKTHPDLAITETHPKVLYWALEGRKYSYQSQSSHMDASLSRRLGMEIHTSNEHEWDAALSAFAALQGMSGAWTHDLFLEQEREGVRLIRPCGPVHYWWPDCGNESSSGTARGLALFL